MSRNWWYVIATMVILAPLIFLFFSTPPLENEQDKHCVINIEAPLGIKYWLNCDSPEFLNLSDDPSKLFEPNNPRQARPGLIVLTWLLHFPIEWVTAPLIEPISSQFHSTNAGVKASKNTASHYLTFFPVFVAYAFVNFLLLAASCYYVVRCTGAQKKLDIVTIIGLSFLVFSSMVQVYYLSPHTNFFNIFYPIFAIFLGLEGLKGKFLQKKTCTHYALLGGVCMLFYQSVIVWLAVILLSNIWYWYQKRSIKIDTLAKKCTYACGIFIAPYALWMLFIHFYVGQFHHYEVKGGQVVWMFQALSEGVGVFWSKYISFVHAFVGYAIAESKSMLYICLGTILASFILTKDKTLIHEVWQKHSSLLISCLTVALLFLAFFTLVGYYPWRIAYNAVPPLLVALIVLTRDYTNLLQPNIRTPLLIIMAAAALYTHFQLLLSPPHYS